jgi:pimeloyl-ACP methyl ester carboxylesterase
MMHKQFLQLSRYRAAYTINGQGDPILLLHGFFGDAEKLAPIISKLESYYCCIAVDLLGFGDSSKPNIQYRVEHQVEFLHELVSTLNLQRFYLAGYSYGAWVAAAYAIAIANGTVAAPPTLLADPLQLLGMALIAPTGIRDDSFVGRYNYLKPLLWDTPFVDIALSIIQPFAVLGGQGKFFKSIRQARRSIMSQPAAKSFMCDRLEPEDAVDTVENEIYGITAPTVVIAGEIDRHIPLWHSQTYAERIPYGSLEIIKGADHDLVETHSTEIATVLQQHW